MARAYQLKISLEDIRPEIWRRVVVPGNLNLERLHGVIQDAMGWEWDHLHEFAARGMRIGVPDDNGWGRQPIEDQRQWTLERLYKGRGKFQYVYDFGDHWSHEIRIEKIIEAEGTFAPRCVAGERACPPEDCGGVGGYLDIVEVLAGKGRRKAEIRDWLGDEWSPQAFDLEAADRLVARHQPQPGRRPGRKETRARAGA